MNRLRTAEDDDLVRDGLIDTTKSVGSNLGSSLFELAHNETLQTIQAPTSTLEFHGPNPDAVPEALFLFKIVASVQTASTNSD